MQLPKLRTLHLRQDFLDNYSDVPSDISGAARHFATGFYQQIEKQAACQSFEALVIGTEMQMGVGQDMETTPEYHPAHCYRNGELIDLYGRTRVVPCLVSLFEFRATSDHAEVVDWYSGWTVDHDWMWRVPDRFHDD